VSEHFDLLLISTNHDEYNAIDFSKFNMPIVDTRNVVKQASRNLFKA